MKKSILLFCALAGLAHGALASQWTPGQANAWYANQPWPVGANYAPASAINQLEMWQAGTFDPQRIDQFLTICGKHGIRPMFVLFDSVWNPLPKAGRQPEPRPHVPNSGWVQSPGAAILGDPSKHDSLRPYVFGVIHHFRNDKRILSYDPLDKAKARAEKLKVWQRPLLCTEYMARPEGSTLETILPFFAETKTGATTGASSMAKAKPSIHGTHGKKPAPPNPNPGSMTSSAAMENPIVRRK
jgi:hypothetical protein